MRRIVQKSLLEWQSSLRRKPLIVRGARQVGKTYTVNQFGEQEFQGNFQTADLEKNRSLHGIFNGDLDPTRIVSELEVVLSARIIPGKTLLFLDEIQTCPRALLALRYFYEELPELHVIAAGSLLDFATKEISFPVGRIQFLDMHPMCFIEYLWALGHEQASQAILSNSGLASNTLHHFLLEELRRYFFVGGMPEAILAYATTKSLHESFEVHKELCNAYRQDFNKYVPYVDPQCLDLVMTAAARNVGRQIKYAQLAEGYTGPTIKKALNLLCNARMLQKVTNANPGGLPLGASASSKVFKVLMVDIGLMHHLCGMPMEKEPMGTDLLAFYRGAMAEQFVGQEMAMTQSAGLYYWSRQAKNSSAEVDYLAEVDGKIHPIEVKSSAAGRLRSLHSLLKSYPNCGVGFVFSSNEPKELNEQRLVFYPLYNVFSQTGGRSLV